MRLDFNVLWIDDQPAAVKGHRERLQEHVEDEGFSLRIEEARSIAEATARIRNHVWTDRIDLVAVDYDLGGGEKGDSILGEVRREMPYKEIVFYSAAPASDLRKKVYQAGVEGVYCADRTTLGETMMGVFDALVKKVLDIDHCRGIILGATSDLEELVSQILSGVDRRINGDDRARLLVYALEKIDERLEWLRKRRDALVSATTMDPLLEQHELFNSMNRLKVLGEACKRGLAGTTPAFNQVVVDYRESITPIRNVFGHAALNDSNRQSESNQPEETGVDADLVRKVRKDLIRLREDFKRLADVVFESETDEGAPQA